MASDKEIIKKLLKIAEQQQKMITKLAQAVEQSQQLGNYSVINDLQAKLSAIPAAKGYQVVDAELASSDGTIHVKLQTTNVANKDLYPQVKDALKKMILGSQLKVDNTNQIVNVSNNIEKINVLRMF